MKLENKVLLTLETENLFEQKVETVQKRLHDVLGIRAEHAKELFEILADKNFVKVEKGIIVKGQNALGLTENALKLDGTTKIGTIVEDEGKMVVKLRGIENQYFDVQAQTDLTQSIGRTCLVDMSFDGGKLVASVKDIYGFADDPISENVAIAAKYGFTNQFDSNVLKEAANIPQEVTAQQRIGKIDMENIPFVTIDPVGCKDKDDAIYDIPTERGFKMYVAIADVSSGVTQGSQLDKEAFKRGNSAYLGGGVYPMLPPELSNGIFSLDEGEPRLALVVSAEITRDGKILNPRVENAVINVKKSYSYEEAEKTYLSQDGFENINKETKQTIDTMYQNTEVLERMLSKMLHIESSEPAYKFSSDGKEVEEIKLSNEEYSHKVVETRMILANEIVAQFFRRKNIAGIYRTHDGVEKAKLERLALTMAYYGVKAKVKNTTASYKKLVDAVKDHPARDYLMGEICRSLSKAKYVATKNKVAHFGIGITDEDPGYMHFTSPIRRYSDLITHRMLKEIMLGKSPKVDIQTLSAVASHLCTQERKAEMAEKESDDYLACMWAQKHQDEMLDGYISQIKGNSIKVMLSNGTVSAYVPVRHLHDAENQSYYVVDNGMKLCGKTKTYSLGDKVKVKIGKVDFDTRTIFGDVCEKAKKEINEKTL